MNRRNLMAIKYTDLSLLSSLHPYFRSARKVMCPEMLKTPQLAGQGFYAVSPLSRWERGRG